ncbi:hypothetical protein HMPREF9371_2276 [Neisseria shayeganii 871]|uniref:Uncharacterized protein n=1 Tax=Neisseria shayeganii 871 TaxID=1032488 RepID=G4CKY5_9NEIS|nr:hypothetical protein HMPREF9371_2276 [Neisseria shayeganii 871]
MNCIHIWGCCKSLRLPEKFSGSLFDASADAGNLPSARTQRTPAFFTLST